jgi:hypothetical protein
MPQRAAIPFPPDSTAVCLYRVKRSRTANRREIILKRVSSESKWRASGQSCHLLPVFPMKQLPPSSGPNSKPSRKRYRPQAVQSLQRPAGSLLRGALVRALLANCRLVFLVEAAVCTIARPGAHRKTSRAKQALAMSTGSMLMRRTRHQLPSPPHLQRCLLQWPKGQPWRRTCAALDAGQPRGPHIAWRIRHWGPAVAAPLWNVLRWGFCSGRQPSRQAITAAR